MIKYSILSDLLVDLFMRGGVVSISPNEMIKTIPRDETERVNAQSSES